MSQFPHDDFVKKYLPELINDYGIASSGKKITSQTKEIDVLFEPKTEQINTNSLGLLGRLLATTCLFEVYRNPVTIDQINECLTKLTDWKTSLKRKLKKNKTPKNLGTKTVKLWILTPTLSDNILSSFRAETNTDWLKGIYFLPKSLSTGIIVIHQLPVNQNTLWLRILGKGKTQENAIDELKALPENNSYRNRVLELVSDLFAMLEFNRNQNLDLTKEDQNLVMKLSSIYKLKLDEAKQEGIQQGVERGIQQGIRQNVVRILKKKIGDLPTNLETRVISLPIEILENLGEALLDFNSCDDLIDWLNKQT